ncbi:hypothetical protein OK016_21180 [Vibrio chagasii]|nr:hypothetical protein [Vibrio chagasii]
MQRERAGQDVVDASTATALCGSRVYSPCETSQCTGQQSVVFPHLHGLPQHNKCRTVE